MAHDTELHRYWNAFSRTAVGDFVVTALVIILISSAFVACAFAVIGVVRGASFMFAHMG